MSYPQILQARKRIKDEEGNTLKSCDNHEGLKTLPRNAMECGIVCAPRAWDASRCRARATLGMQKRYRPPVSTMACVVSPSIVTRRTSRAFGSARVGA